jgi:chromosome segregation ATPase
VAQVTRFRPVLSLQANREIQSTDEAKQLHKRLSHGNQKKKLTVVVDKEDRATKINSLEQKGELLSLELVQTRAELVNTTVLLRETDSERKDLQKKLENVSSAVRLKAIGLLMTKVCFVLFSFF